MALAGNRYSQNGEDGVIAGVVLRLGLAVEAPGTFVEFGAGDGVTLSNTLSLANAGWSGVWIEANMESAAKAAQLAAESRLKVEVINAIVDVEGDNRLDALLSATRVPKDLDFMSIDIDSFDLEVWQSVQDYRPKIVLIEINSSVPIGTEQTHGNGKEGASFTSMMKVAAAKKYTLACHTGNLLFVDSAFADKLGLLPEEIADPSLIFNDMWVHWAAGTQVRREW